MSTPNPLSGSVPLGMDSDVGETEWNVFLRRRAELIDVGMRRLGLANQISAMTGTGVLPALQMTSLIVSPEDEVRQQALQSPVTDPEYRRLLGAADFYGIDGAETIDPTQLRQMVEQRREYLVSSRSGSPSLGDELYDTFATFIGSTGLGMVDAVVEGSKHIPFMGDAIRKSRAVQNYQRGLAMLEEGFTGDMVDSERAAYEKFARPLQHFLGYSALVGTAAEAVGATGFAGGVANPLVRGSLQGGATGWLLEGGGDDPISERALKVALFAGVQGAAEWGLPKIAARLRRSFPRPSEPLEAEWYRPNNPRPNAPRDWREVGVVDEVSVGADGVVTPRQIGPPPRQLGPGSLEGELLPVQALASGPRLLPEESLFVGEAEWSIAQGQRLLPRPALGPGQYEMPPAPPRGIGPGDLRPGTFRAGPGVVSFPRNANSRPLTMEEASVDAIAATKQGTVLESPALPQFAKSPQIQDADVALAAMASNPGQISVVQGVGDTGQTIRRFLQETMPNGIGPQDFRVITRNNQTDVLVADGRTITNKMAKEYQTFGMFRGQQAVTSEGLQVVVEQLGAEFSTVRRLGSSSVETVPTAELMPGKSSAIADALPEAYLEFRGFAQSRMAQEAVESGLNPMKVADWFSEELATQLPRYIDEFLDLKGVQGQGVRGTYTSAFTEARVADFRTLAPEEFALADEIGAEVNQAYNLEVAKGSRPLYLEEVAESNGMAWVPAPGAQGGTLLDRVTGEEIALESTEAAFQFLQNFNRTLPDYSPFSVAPVELSASAVGAANPGSSFGPRHYMTEVDVIESASKNLDHLEAAIGGGGMGLPPGSSGGGSFGPFGEPGYLPPGEETLGRQIQRLRTERPRTYDEVMNRFDSLALRAFEPMRNFALAIEDTLQSVGVTRGTYWQHYSNIVQGRAIAHNEAVPWHREINDSLNLIRRKFIRDGTVTLIGEMPEPIALDAMRKAGYTEREVTGQLRIRQTLERLRLEYSEPGNEIARILDYMPHLRARSARGEPLGDLDEMFGGAGKFFAREIREGGIDVREMNAATLLHRWVRAATTNRHVSGPINEMTAAWVDDPIIGRMSQTDAQLMSLREATSDWLSLIARGHTPGQDVLIPGVRHALNALKIPVTNAEVTRGLNWIFVNMYRGALGGRPDVIVRDLIGPLFGATRTGFKPTAQAYAQFFKGGAARQEMVDLALRGGWMERGMVPMGASEMFQGGYGMVPGVQVAENSFSPVQNMVREGVARAGDFVRDALPPAMRSGIQGTKADPLYWYTKEGEFNRLISGHSGYIAMQEAIQAFDAARIAAPDVELKGLVGQLLTQSGAANYPAPVQRRIAELVTSRQYEEAAFTFANEVANSQFRYGTAEQSLAVRSAGSIGRFGSTFGTFTQQYLAQMKEGLGAGLLPEFGGTSVDRVRSGVGFLGRHSAIAGALGLATAYTGWNFGKWFWHGSLGWGGGPMLLAFVAKVQEVTGKFNQAQGEFLSPMQRWAVQQSQSQYESPMSFPNNLNPYGGALRTVEGLGQTMSSANPLEGTAEFLTTGRRNAGDMVREFNNAPFGLQEPPGWAPPPPWAQGQVPPPDTLWIAGGGATQ
jgi:hypothetical protein